MNFTHYDLGGLGKGKTIEVLLQGNSANVYLMDHPNMIKYNKGQPFQALGGLMTFSPIRFQTTETAHWHLVIDLPKGYGTVKTSYRVLNKQPPNISTRPATFRHTEAQLRAVEAGKAANLKTDKTAEKSINEEKPSPPKPAERISCPSCKILTKLGKFCTECGEPIEKSCPGCSASNTLTSKFCYECGFNLASLQIKTAAYG